jgi:hypothetical protein
MVSYPQVSPIDKNLLILHSRVDLRPVTSHDSTASHDPDSPTATTHSEVGTSHRHRSAFRDILSLRHRPNATPQERIYYLRRLRDQRRNRSGDVAGEGTETSRTNDDTADRRRSARISARLSNVFNGRMRMDRSPAQAHSPPSSEQPAARDVADSMTQQ